MIGKFAGCEGMSQALPCLGIHDTQGGVGQAFAPAAAIVAKTGGITVIRLQPDIDLFVNGCVFTIVKAVVGAIVALVEDDRSVGLAVAPFNER